MNYEIYKYAVVGDWDTERVPKSLNPSMDLDSKMHPVVTSMVNGVVGEIVAYGEVDITNPLDPQYSSPVSKHVFTYERNAQGRALTRSEVITWCLEDGSYGEDSKTRIKVYDQSAQDKEAHRRADNIVTSLKNALPDYLLMLEVEDPFGQIGLFFSKYGQEVYNYERSQNDDLKSALLSDTEFSWLNLQIPPGVPLRHAAVAAIDIWYGE